MFSSGPHIETILFIFSVSHFNIQSFKRDTFLKSSFYPTAVKKAKLSRFSLSLMDASIKKIKSSYNIRTEKLEWRKAGDSQSLLALFLFCFVFFTFPIFALREYDTVHNV